nr:integrase, catalytic region, zinc finger, CCHC-type, peptidase aspartic, catalytic [Tanacetum cinerariifolium]
MASAPQIEYAPIAHHPSELSSPKTGLVVLVFQKGDDLIDAINHMMSFLTSVVTFRVIIQPIQGRQNQMSAGSSRLFTSGSGGTSRRQRVIVCYNCKGEGHMAKQCTKPKRKRDADWFKDKVLLVQAQASGQKEESRNIARELALEKQGTWGFEYTKACFHDDIIPFVKSLKELFTSFDQCLIDEVTEVQNVFTQMELAVEKHSLKEQLDKLKGKAVITKAVSLNPIDPELLKVDVTPVVLKLRKNRTAHIDYIRHTKEEAATLRKIIESERLLSPLNTFLDYACCPNRPMKFLGTVKFGNDHVAKIMGYRDYQIGNVTISRVYYMEGLGHNLFSIGQFCDSNLEVAFRQHTCFICNLDGVDLLTGSRGNNLYTLSIQDMMASSPICFLSK